MFQTIKDKLSAGVIIMLAVTLLLVGLMLAVTKADLATTKANFEKSQMALSTLQTDLDNATVQLKAAEIEKERLRLDAALTAKTLNVREQGRNTIDAELVDTKAKAKVVMESSTNESDKSWTVAAVPDELNRLLEQRSYCANSDNDQDSVCVAGRVTSEQVPNTHLFRPNQSRSL